MLHALLWEALSSHLMLHVACYANADRNVSQNAGGAMHPAAKYFSNRASMLGVKRIYRHDQRESSILTPELISECWGIMASFCEIETYNLTITSVDDCLERAQENIACHLGVTADSELLKNLLAPLFADFGPTTFLTELCCRSEIIAEILGTSLAKHLRQNLHLDHWNRSPTDPINIADLVLRELAATRQELTRIRHLALTSQDEHLQLTTEEVGDSLILRKSHIKVKQGL